MTGKILALGAVAALALAAVSMWRGMAKGARIQRRREAIRAKYEAEVKRRTAEKELEAAKAKEQEASRRLEDKKRDAQEELDRAASTPDDAVGDALDDELGRG